MGNKVTMDDVTPALARGGETRVLLSPKTVGSTSGFLGAFTLMPGESISEHYHPHSEEFVFVVKGELVMRVDDLDYPLTAGEALFLPKNTRHRLTNPGTERGLAIFLNSPLAPHPSLGHVDTEPLPYPDAPTPQVGAPQ